ncbi:F-actin capping protein beta subunit [Capsaspora owczarzaki ATCC 30864]|uniref:F-actin-capping protein subunit alpha n=1 Tax=Capsaspora owczarzaki (strain ATCC 30864) TaxID=595528 RepID=A0A0D2X2W5_CAPO3|nr:F-actin capping protein beta subunit [Capsaspora owczarzaki ATCC 30864]KJE93269.1 F-actin capping protein beta subunit [Capsaspora owczarzaki ATCC 30864]|eukprot:XP_004347906.1 F-actin capping protein beta subunit [Capsaspora owczarzaki ATCC 30864]
MSYEEQIPDSEKVKIASSFILAAPAGEFNEVFNDVRVLLSNDDLLKRGAANAFSQYNKDQFTPVDVPGASHKTLITKHNEVQEGTFFDPRSGQTFSFDHLRREADNAQPGQKDAAETLRNAIDNAIRKYTENHYPDGVSAVFASTSGGQVTLAICIEDHKFNPNNFWNGRWRSEWTATFASSGGPATLNGALKVQVHYYEDGNVQLQTNKDVSEPITIGNPESAASAIIAVIEKAENEYQTAISENYSVMSDTTFKALRRVLPVTRSKIEWGKMFSYKVGAELHK